MESTCSSNDAISSGCCADCSAHTAALDCTADAACGWCFDTATCQSTTLAGTSCDETCSTFVADAEVLLAGDYCSGAVDAAGNPVDALTQPVDAFCYARGVCERPSTYALRECGCSAGFAGDGCQFTCPGYPDNVCSGSGVCDADTGKCLCECGFHGDNCEVATGCTSDGKFCTWGTDCSIKCGAKLTAHKFSGSLDEDGVTCNCAEGWWGEDCGNLCPGLTLSTSGQAGGVNKVEGVECGGHGNCDRATGQCTCEPCASLDNDGSCVADTCPACDHGSCVCDQGLNARVCECFGDYTGELCDTCGCFNLDNGARCNSVTGECVCDEDENQHPPLCSSLSNANTANYAFSSGGNIPVASTSNALTGAAANRASHPDLALGETGSVTHTLSAPAGASSSLDVVALCAAGLGVVKLEVTATTSNVELRSDSDKSRKLNNAGLPVVQPSTAVSQVAVRLPLDQVYVSDSTSGTISIKLQVAAAKPLAVAIPETAACSLDLRPRAAAAGAAITAITVAADVDVVIPRLEVVVTSSDTDEQVRGRVLSL